MKMRNQSEFFHPRKFVGNNINYRIASSSSLAKYKETQAFILNQLAQNPFHSFSRSAKEILLFKFDICFDFLCEVEQYFLIKERGTVKKEEIWELIEARKRYEDYTLSEVDNIDQNFYKSYLNIKEELFKYYDEFLEVIIDSGLNSSSLFGSMVDITIQALNHVLYLLEELDIIYFTNKKPIIILDNFSCELSLPKSKQKICTAISRLKEYREIRDFDEIIIKNYIGGDFVISVTEFSEFLEKEEIKYTLI